MYIEGQTGVITFNDNKISKVKIVSIITYPASSMPTDYRFAYLDDETHRPLTQPEFNDNFHLPEGLVNMVFKAD